MDLGAPGSIFDGHGRGVALFLDLAVDFARHDLADVAFDSGQVTLKR